MRILLVEDDYINRKLLETFLHDIKDAVIDIAIDGNEALELFHTSLTNNEPYDLICLDIMLPFVDGHSVLKEIRKTEKERGIYGLDGTKVVMTTALSDAENIMAAFNSQCEAYITKPIDRNTFFDTLRAQGLLE